MSNRRQFLLQSSAAVAGAWFLPSVVMAAAKPSEKFPRDPRARISVASYSFREFIVGPRSKSGDQSIALKDFGAHVVQKFNVNKIEPWTGHFPSTDREYLEEFRHSFDQAGAAVADIAVDGPASIYSADPAECEKAIAFSKQWLDNAVVLGSPNIRTNISRAKNTPPDLDRLPGNLRQVADYAESKRVVVHLENDDAVSEDPFFLVKVLEKVNSPWLHALPDFGNTLSTHDDDYNYKAIDAMFAHAYGICHVKDGLVNDDGKATHVDLARTFAILKKHSYKGYCSIEYDAPGDPYKPTAELIAEAIKFLS